MIILDFVLGILLAGIIIYLFWKWLNNGYSQWEKWDKSELTLNQQKTKETRIKYFITPNRWLSDTVPYVSFWVPYYKIKYGNFIPF